MPIHLFNFDLVPLDQVTPWGEPDAASLHWWGLTDGWYWLQVGEHRLFEYSGPDPMPHRSRFCDYYVARLYEDVTSILPEVLDPVPDDLRDLIALPASSVQPTFLTRCEDLLETPDLDETIRDHLFTIVEWIQLRYLDTGHLCPSTSIGIWSDQTSVHVQWDNRRKLLNGKEAWSARYGTLTFAKDHFLKEVSSFHERLMASMEDRVRRVLDGALGNSVKIDLPELQREQDVRSQPIKLKYELPETNWTRIRQATSAVSFLLTP